MTTWRKRPRDPQRPAARRRALAGGCSSRRCATARRSAFPEPPSSCTATREVIPSALLHSLKHYKALHQQVILLTVSPKRSRIFSDEERFSSRSWAKAFYRVTGRYGYMEEPDIPALLERVSSERGMPIPPMDTTYFLGRETLIITARPSGMASGARSSSPR